MGTWTTPPAHRKRGPCPGAEGQGVGAVRPQVPVLRCAQDHRQVRHMNQKRDHPQTLHGTAGRSKPKCACDWELPGPGRIQNVFITQSICLDARLNLNEGQSLHLTSHRADFPGACSGPQVPARPRWGLGTHLRPYSLQMAVFWAMLMSMSSDRLCFQCRRSEALRASISLLAVFPAKALC